MQKRILTSLFTGILTLSLLGIPACASEEALSFEDFKALQFVFSSGAGGWGTTLSIAADGSFSGEFFDGEMGLTGEEYPGGTMYQCEFSGQLTAPEKLDDHTYSMTIQEIHYQQEPSTEEIIDEVLYSYTTPYGLENTETLLVYLPGTDLTALPEAYRSWVGYSDLTATEDTSLPFYGLYNEAEQCGFSSYSFLDSLQAMLSATEESAAAIETSLQNDALTQAEYNEKSLQLYECWDAALNNIWGILKKTLDTASMEALTTEELAWINSKEQLATEAGAEYEGGSLQTMIVNCKAAELTQIRVYELLELLK